MKPHRRAKFIVKTRQRFNLRWRGLILTVYFGTAVLSN